MMTIGTSVDSYVIAREILGRTITEYVDSGLTRLGHSCFRMCNTLETFICHGVTTIGASVFDGCSSLTSLAFPNVTSISSFGTVANLKKLDFGESFKSISSNMMGVPELTDLILRRENNIVGTSVSTMNSTPMKSGGTGCNVYIPKTLYDHLGDGSSLDYKANNAWATYDGYGTITWRQIEGSIYETEYADGTTISTGGN